jgi:sugar lactone lactonase YvrE
MPRSFLGVPATRVSCLLLSLLATLLLPGAAPAQTAYFSGAVATLDSGFSRPLAVAVDGNGNVFVADTGNSAVKEIVAAGGYTTIDTLGSGFNGPEGMAVDGSGNVYVADTGNSAVKKIPASCIAGANNSSCVLTLGSGFNIPVGVAVDGSGNVYVADTGNSAVKKIPASCIAGANDSSCMLTLGSGFKNPNGAAVDGSGNVFIADTGNSAVKEIPASCIAGVNNSSCVLALGSGFSSPKGVAVDGSGDVFVADYNNNAVKEIVAGTGGAAAGTVNASSKVNTLGGGFSDPQGVAVAGSGNVFVADSSNNAVKEFTTASGNFGSVEVGSPSSAPLTLYFTFNTGATLGPNAVLTQGAPNLDFHAAAGGTCAVGTAHTAGQTCTVNVTFKPLHPGPRYGAVELLNGSGKLLATGYVRGIGTGPQAVFANTTSGAYLPSAQTTLGSGFSEPGGAAVDGAGNVYVADFDNSAVKEIPAAGGPVQTLGNGFSFPYDVAVDGAGNVFVADSLNSAVKKMPPGCVSSACVTTLGSGLSYPYGVAVDGSGNVFVADYGNNAVKEIVAAAGYTTVNTLGSGFNGPVSVAVDGSGNVFVSDLGNNAVKEIPASCIAGANNSSCVLTLGSGFIYPFGLAVDGSGNVFVADDGSSTVNEIMEASDYTTVTTLGSGFFGPTGVAVDGSGNVFVADQGNNAVKKLDYSDGPSLSFATTPASYTSSDSPQKVTIGNDGNQTLTFPLPATGTNPAVAANFAWDNASTCEQTDTGSPQAFTLAAGASCTAAIDFTPLSVGSIAGSVVLTDDSRNASPSTTQSISLSGTASEPPVTQLVFGVAPIANIPAGGNAGSAVTVQEEAADGFVSTEAADGITLTVTYPDTTTQIYSATAASGVATFNLGGVVLTEAGTYTYTASFNVLNSAVATETVVAGAYADPATSVGTPSATQTATLYVSSNFTLGSIAVLTQGAPNLDFQAAAGGACAVGTAYTVGQTCTVNYTFTPAHPGPRYGAVVLYDNASPANAVVTAHLQGTGNGPQVIFSSNNIQSVLGRTNGGAAVDASGDVFIDAGTSVTEIPAGCASSACQITLGGGLTAAAGLAVDGAGNVFVADSISINDEVDEIPFGCHSAACVSMVGPSFAVPTGAAVDGNGNVFVADWQGSAVMEILAGTGGAAAGAVNSNSTAYNLGGVFNFNYPQGVAVDGSGNVYVADTGNSAVEEIFAAGGYTTGNFLGNEFGSPQGVAVDGSGNVFVADYGNNAVYEILAGTGGAPAGTVNSSSTVITVGGGFDNPSGVAVDGSGNLFVADSSGVKKLDFSDAPSLNFVNTLAGSTSSDSPQTVTLANDGNETLTFSAVSYSANFPEAPGVATDCASSTPLASDTSCTLSIDFAPLSVGSVAGSVALTDNSLNASPSVTQSILLSGTATGPPATLAFGVAPPVGVAPGGNAGSAVTVEEEDLNGNVVPAADTITLTVNYPDATTQTYTATAVSGVAGFNLSGAALTQAGTYTYTASFSGLTSAVAFETVAQMAYTDPNTGVGTPSATQTATLVLTTNSTLGSIALLTQGAPNLDFQAAAGGTCAVGTAYTTAQTCTVNYTFNPKHPGPRNGAIVLYDNASPAHAVAMVYVQGTGNGPQVIFSSNNIQSVLGSGFISPQAAAVDGAGNVFVADSGSNAVKEILAAGGYTTVNTLGSGFNDPTSVALDGADNVFVADQNNRVVKEILAAGGYTTVNTLGSGFSSPDGVAVDGAGNVFVADEGTGTVDEIVAAGGYTTINTVGSGYANPYGVALDGSGNVFVTDPGSSAVDEIPASCIAGANNSSCMLTLGSGFTFPDGVAVDASDNVFVADSGTNAVSEILAAGGYTTMQTLGSGFNFPYGVAVDGSGNVFVADTGNHAVKKLDYSDGPSLSFATTPAGTTSSDSPHTVTVANDGNQTLTFNAVIYGSDFPEASGVATDCTSSTTLASDVSCTLSIDFSPLSQASLTESVTLTDNSPNTTQSISVSGTATEAPATQLVFVVPPAAILTERGNAGSAVTVEEETASGTVYTGAADTITLTVTGPHTYSQSYTATAASGVATFNLSGVAPAEPGVYTFTASLTGLTSAVASETVVAAYAAPATSVGTPSATQAVLLFLNSNFTLGSIAVLTKGAPNLDFQAAVEGTCVVGRAYKAGQTCTVNYIFNPKHPGPRDGAVVLYDNASPANAVATVYLEGTGNGPQLIFSSNNIQSVLGSGFSGPAGAAVDGSDNVFVADSSNSAVKEILASGGYTTVNTLGAGFNSPTGVAVDGAGNVFAADKGNNAVYEILAGTGGAAAGTVNSSSTVIPVGSGFSKPNGVAVDGSGNVFVADSGNNAVKQIVSAGGYTTVNILGSGFSSPKGVAVDGSDNVFVADYGNNAVKEILAAGGYTTVSTLAVANGNFNSPQGVAVDGGGNVFVADYGNNAVKEILAAGGYTTVNTPGSGFSEPAGVAVGVSGNVFVADYGNKAVKKLDFSDAPSVAFATTAVGSTSSDSPRTVTLENDGNSALTFPIPSTGSDPAIAANFTLNSSGASACPLLTSGSSTPGTLAAGASCQLPLSFTPAAAGALSGSLVLTDSNLNAPAPGYATQTITMSGTGTQATPTITWAAPADITYGTALSATQLDASANAPGSFAYTPAAGTVPAVGPQTLSVTFTPTVTTAYTTATATVALTVNPATSATLYSPAPNVGTALGSSNVLFQWTSGTATKYELYLGTTGVGSSNLYSSGKITALSASVITLPANGVTVFARLYSLIGAVWQSTDYTYVESGTFTLATLSPTAGTVLSASQTFSWANGAGPIAYELYLGTTGVGSSNLHSSGQTTATSATVTLPTNGVIVYARLYQCINGVWQSADTTYVEGGTITPATLSPTASTVLTSSQTFSWANGNGPSAYELYLGTAGVGSDNLYTSGQTTATSETVTLPTYGVTVFARLYQRINGVWQSADTTYVEGGTITPATLSPTAGTVLTSSQTFSWANGAGPSAYELYLGTSGVGSDNLYSSGQTTATSETVTLPTKGVKVYARLYQRINNVWQSADTTYTETP